MAVEYAQRLLTAPPKSLQERVLDDGDDRGEIPLGMTDTGYNLVI